MLDLCWILVGFSDLTKLPKSHNSCSTLVPPAGFEPATFGLEVRCSLRTELRRRIRQAYDVLLAHLPFPVGRSGTRPLCCGSTLVAVAQLAERRVVVADVAGSNPVGHPIAVMRSQGISLHDQ